MVAKVDIEPEPEVAAKPEPKPTVADESEPDSEVAAESESAVVDEPKPEVEIEKLLVGTSVDLPTELAMELVSFTLAVRVLVSLSSPDACNPLQIFLKAT